MSGCCLGVCDFLRKRLPLGGAEERAKFEKVILFLASVPLFKKQLPKAELPVLAQRLTERHWKWGTTLVKQGETGKTFFLIYSGRASVMTQDEKGHLVERAVLSEGDWLGGHTLTEERPNVATVVAKGPGELVTLEMTKRDFELSGLKGKLKFCKRPAMRVSAPEVNFALGNAVQRAESQTATADTPDEQDFIIQSFMKNPNLRFLKDFEVDIGGEGRTTFREIASIAQRRRVEAGTEVAKCGELGQEFFVIRDGSFEVIVNPSSKGASSKRSAESAVSAISLAERINRKQDFLTQLHRPIGKTHRCHSVLTRDPRQYDERQPRAPKRGISSLIHNTSFIKKDGIGDEVSSQTVAATLQTGESFGELSLLYNTRREATFRAAVDAEIYVISRRQFKQFLGQGKGTKRFQDCVNLLDEVDALSPLLRSERRELATNVLDFVALKPGQRILTQGKPRTNPMWYVIFAGSVALSQDDPSAPGGRKRLGKFSRGSHFGLLKEEDTYVSEMHVDAGPRGVTCVTFDGELVRELFRGMASVEEKFVSSFVKCDSESDAHRSGRRNSSRKRSIVLGQLHQYEDICILGKGGFGTVFLAQDTEKNRIAIKRISKGLAQQEEIIQQLCWERDLMSMLASPFIIQLLGTCRDDQFVYLLMEAALGGDLYGAFHKNTQVFMEDKPKGSSTMFYAACIIEALEHLHERKIVYRDVKPENVLLDLEGYGKICDMGLARFVVGKTNTQVGTPDYMAPEMIDPPHYHDFSADWWALGVLTFELLNRQTPFDDDGLDDMQERLLAIRRSQELGKLAFDYNCPPAARNFIERLLKKLPGRLGADGGAKEVRKHAWLKKLDFEALRARKLPTPLQIRWEDPTEPSPGLLCEIPKYPDDLYVPYRDDGTNWDAPFVEQ